MSEPEQSHVPVPAAPADVNRWRQVVEADPEHSHRYADRWRRLREEGADVAGEARLVDAVLPRGGLVLDAGCGTGRLASYLSAAGHQVVGVDLDPVLVAAATADQPGRFVTGDLAALAEVLAAAGLPPDFDAVVCAGNVVTFLAPDERRLVLAALRAVLRSGARLLVGFGGDRGYPFADFLTDAVAVGLVVEHELSSWDLRPFDSGSDFLVAVLGRDGSEPAQGG